MCSPFGLPQVEWHEGTPTQRPAVSEQAKCYIQSLRIQEGRAQKYKSLRNRSRQNRTYNKMFSNCIGIITQGSEHGLGAILCLQFLNRADPILYVGAHLPPITHRAQWVLVGFAPDVPFGMLFSCPSQDNILPAIGCGLQCSIPRAFLKPW